jgi:hypothetical protein
MEVKVNINPITALVNRARAASEDIIVDAHKFFVDNTPVRSGNARQRTRLQGDSIVADYAYAERLNEGYSKQNPNGMVDPTVEHIEKVLVPKAIRRAQNGQ